MTTLRRNTVPLSPSSGGGTSVHALNDRSIHTGQLSEQFVDFDNAVGHNHDGVGSRKVDHSALLNAGVVSHSQIDAHISKAIAVPQTEQSASAINTTYYRIADNTPVFVGRAGSTAAAVVALLGQDVVVGASGNPVTVVGITSDQAGTTSVVGSGYVAHPYVQFSEAIPNKQIRIRYGIGMTLDTLPESVLINEPLWIGETDQDTRSLIAEIKGGAFDRTIASTQNLQGLDGRITTNGTQISGLNSQITTINSQLTTIGGQITGIDGQISTLSGNVAGVMAANAAGRAKQFGFAPEYPNMVFDNSGLVGNSNGTWLGGFESSGNVFHTYLSWATNLASAQRYRIRLMVKLPRDFGAWDSVCPLRLWRKSEGLLSNVSLNVTLHDSANSVTNINQAVASNLTLGAWEQFAAPAVTPGSFNFLANGWCCLTLEAMANGAGNVVKIGRIDFNYLTA